MLATIDKSNLPVKSGIAEMEEAGIATFHAKPKSGDGPIFLFFDALGTYPGAKDEEVFAAGAVLTQAGNTLASFQAMAVEEYQRAPDWWHNNAERSATVKAMPSVPYNGDLNKAFAMFVTLCWMMAYEAMEPNLPFDTKLPNDGKSPSAMVRSGMFHVVHSGLLMNVESGFFHRTPITKATEEVFKEQFYIYQDTLWPLHIQKMCSLAVGMGYGPGVVDSTGVVNALGLPPYNGNPLQYAKRLSAIFWAVKARDPRLKAFRLLGW